MDFELDKFKLTILKNEVLKNGRYFQIACMDTDENNKLLIDLRMNKSIKKFRKDPSNLRVYKRNSKAFDFIINELLHRKQPTGCKPNVLTPLKFSFLQSVRYRNMSFKVPDATLRITKDESQGWDLSLIHI